MGLLQCTPIHVSVCCFIWNCTWCPINCHVGTRNYTIQENATRKQGCLHIYRNNSVSHWGSTTKNYEITFISCAPVHIPCFTLRVLGGRFNFYKMIENILSIRPDCDSDRLLLQIKRGLAKPEEVFTRQHVGKAFFDPAVKPICREAGVRCLGMNEYLTNYGLRSSMTSLLTDAGHTDSSKILHTGHSNTTTLARYHHLRGNEGLRHQESLFQTTADEHLSSNPAMKAKLSGDLSVLSSHRRS